MADKAESVLRRGSTSLQLSVQAFLVRNNTGSFFPQLIVCLPTVGLHIAVNPSSSIVKCPFLTFGSGRMADSTPKSYSADDTLYLYTSLTAGSSHIITATSRMETILKANRIAFRALDVATDEKARMLWGRRSKGRKLPGLVRYGSIVGVSKNPRPSTNVTKPGNMVSSKQLV